MGQCRQDPFAPGTGIICLGAPIVHPGDPGAFLGPFMRTLGKECEALRQAIGTLGHAQVEHALLRPTRAIDTSPVITALATFDAALCSSLKGY